MTEDSRKDVSNSKKAPENYDRLQDVPWIRKTFFAVCAVLVLLDFVFETKVPFPGYYALFGAAICAITIVVSKLVGKLLLQKGEDYYG